RGDALHPAGSSLPGRRRPADQLPPATLDAAGTGLGLRGLGPHPVRLRGGTRRGLPLLQLRRRDADPMSGLRFEVLHTTPSGGRLGRLTTPHGVVETPAFMPVATHGAVKGVAPRHLQELGATIVLSNAYHLAQRPGVE